LTKVETFVTDYDRSKLTRPIIGQEASELTHQKIQAHQVPKPQLSMKSCPNGISYFRFPMDRAAILHYELDEQLQDFIDVYYRGDTDD